MKTGKAIPILICLFSFFALIVSLFFFTQDLQKNYHCNKLAIMVGSLKNAIIHTRSFRTKRAIVEAALPILYGEEQAFLKPAGYWPMIFNGYTQAATVENINMDYQRSARLLLMALHYHPYLDSAYKGLAEVLEKSGQTNQARSCKRYQRALLRSRGIKNEDRTACIMAAQKIAGL